MNLNMKIFVIQKKYLVYKIYKPDFILYNYKFDEI